MGQGFYTAIVFGAIQQVDDKDEGSTWYDLVYDTGKKHKVQGRLRYESRQPWFGFFIAENGSGISDRGDGCELFSYETMELTSLPSEVEKRWPKQLKKCRQAYADLIKAASAKGIELPAGRLLFVNDYD